MDEVGIGPVVSTGAGRWRGRLEQGLVVFRGIPYAAPPTGPRRFCPPLPPERFDGINDAGAFGPIAPQLEPMPGTAIPGEAARWSEDCLTCNVWTEGCDDGRRPVMVFVHGGAFVTGAGSWTLYDGRALAQRHTVVVTFNYRLGVLGWLAHPLLRLGEGAPAGNWGLADQVALLDWVQENIGGFGGDPGNVTIFGESAGAMSVVALLSTAARGRFRRAIVESGPAVAQPLEQAARTAELVASAIDHDSFARERLLSTPVEQLLAAQQQVMQRFDGGIGLAFQPVIDDGLLSRHPLDAIAEGVASSVDLVVGTNRDEFRFFTVSAQQLVPHSEEALIDVASRYLSETASAVPGSNPVDAEAAGKRLLTCYRDQAAARGDSTAIADLFLAMATDFIFRVPSLRLAAAQVAAGGTCYVYRFDWESPVGGGILGACHALELPFVFGTLDNPLVALFSGSGPEATQLSEWIQQAWTGFARSGDPSIRGLGERGSWPRYDAATRRTMLLGSSCQVVEAPGEPERAVWDELGFAEGT